MSNIAGAAHFEDVVAKVRAKALARQAVAKPIVDSQGKAFVEPKHEIPRRMLRLKKISMAIHHSVSILAYGETPKPGILSPDSRL